MAASWWIDSHIRTFSSHVKLLLFVILLLSYRVQSQPILLYYKPTEAIHSSSNGVFRLLTNDNSSIQLFGLNINQSTIVKFTQSDIECNEQDSLYGSGDIISINDTDTMLSSLTIIQASYYVHYPLIKSTTLLYFCLKNADDIDYYHQGSSDWLKVEVFPPSTVWLPLPVRILFILVLMLLSGTFSGLNLGLMALDPTTLKIIEKSGSKRQKKYAKVIHRVRRHGNYLLCTLLLGNVLVNSTFTILLDDIISGVYAIIGSTLAIVLFGEIIPQAICSRYGLLIGAYSIWLTYFFMVLTFPLSFPISLILNLILGKEIGAVYNRDQLLELLHVTQKDTELEDCELNIISGALRYKEKTVKDVMTKFQDVFCVDVDSLLDFRTIKMIYDSGFSRIPIYEQDKSNIVGILYLRDLTFIDPEDCTPVRQVRDFYNREPKCVFEDVSLEDMLKEFTQGQYHIAIVRCVEEKEDSDPEYITIGVVTLEDIIEEILGREINDEFDQFEDNVTLKPRHRKNMDIGEIMYTTPIIRLSAHQLLAVKQFLSSAVPPFQIPHITKHILDRLLQQDIVYELSHDQSKNNGFALYQTGIPASYFTLLLEGCLKVQIGKESLSFEARGYHFFGSQVLLDVIESNCDYIPDYTVRPQTDCLVLLITKQRYLAAYRASQLGNTIQDTSKNNEQNDEVFNEEWLAAETHDLQSSLSGGLGLTNIKHLLKTKPLQEYRNHISPNSITQPPHSPHRSSKSPQRFLKYLANSPGPSRTYNLTVTEEDYEDYDENDCERTSLLGIESDSTHNTTPIIEVIDSDQRIRTTKSLSDLESAL